MGLLSALSSLFGRSGGRTRGGTTTPPGRFEHGGAGDSPHRRHWDALVEPAGRDTAVRGLTMRTVNRGEEIGSAGGGSVTGYRLGDGPLATVAVTADGKIATAYPITIGPEHVVRVTGRRETSGLESRVDLALADAELTAFAANYFQHSRGYFDGEREAAIAMLCYALGPTESASAGASNDADGTFGSVEVEPWSRGARDDYRFQTTVEAVDPISHGGYDAYRVAAPLVRTDGGDEVTATFFVGRHLLGGYEPEAGDAIEGVGWLQAWFR